ncbi:MAG: cation diffusion facilitator family transporter [Patescibacteria group bacterium]
MPLKKIIGFTPVIAALLGNTLVTAIKLCASILSGSSAMFAETIHSLADTLNQGLLLIGLQRSTKKADSEFEYGYGNERFFWALISACGIFFVGAGITAYNGLSAFTSPHDIELTAIVFVVLFLSLGIEGYTFFVADRNLKQSFPDATWRERFSRADPSTLAVYLEDAVAVIGILIATISITLSYYTKNPLWDAVGAMLISFLLISVAITLIAKNRSYLIGRSMPRDMQEEVVEFLTADPAIEKVIDFKSTTLGFGSYRIKCEIEFNGPALFQEAFQREALKDQYEEIKDDYEAFKRHSVDYADRIPRLMGKKIDEIEGRLKKHFPSIQHIDIEIN